MALRAGGLVPASGRYALQGAQVRAGLELWARRAGAELELVDDESRSERAVGLYGALLARCDLVLGPYGSDCVRAVARAGFPPPLWNHGGAADDVQRLPGVVSVPSPASRYLVALGKAVAVLRPGSSVALLLGRGAFARFAGEALEREAGRLGVRMVGVFSPADPPEHVAGSGPDAVLLCGPVEEEVRALRGLRGVLPGALLGGVSPGLHVFPEVLEADVEGLLAPSQWHPMVPNEAELGPSSEEVLADARASDAVELDYVAAQAYACALIAARCRELSPGDSLAAARALETSTFFGRFALDPESGIQVGHRLCVVRWRGGEQELLLADAA